MDRKDFMRNVYSDYWLDARDKIYGFMPYDHHLCELITAESGPGSALLEVAIGTGYPFADFFQKAGYDIHGIDISAALVQRCLELNPKIKAEVGDAENLPYDDATFDLTYSFHSTWYFPDMPRVIAEMRRVTRPGGAILFDIQNRANAQVEAAYQKRLSRIRPGLLPRAELHARNLAKVVLRRGTPNWHALNYEVPTDPRLILDSLRAQGVPGHTVYARDEGDQSLSEVDADSTAAWFPRLVYLVRA